MPGYYMAKKQKQQKIIIIMRAKSSDGNKKTNKDRFIYKNKAKYAQDKKRTRK